MKKRPAFKIGKAIMVLALASGSVLSSPLAAFADAETSTVRTHEIGYLKARGAAVAVSATVKCPSGTSYASLSVDVVQRVSGGNIARGYGYTSRIVCDGTPGKAEIIVTAQSYAFRKGPAFVTSSLAVCDPSSCVYPTDSREVRFVASQLPVHRGVLGNSA